jgi:hypothetical protein
MSYGLKYTATAKGISPNVWRVEFEEKNFTPANGSTPIQLTLVGDGLRIGYDREDDRFNLIYSRYAEIALKVTNTFNISTLQFDDERKYKIKIYKANILEFVGWLIPSFPSQEFEDSSIATFKIMAKDTLNQLKQIRFVNEKPTDITNKDSFTNLIAQCLRQTGIELNFEIYYNKYEDRMSKTINDCPLNQLTCDVTSFKSSTGENLNYYEVLEILLQQHDLKIIQAEGKWLIYSQIELFDGSIVGRTYNYLGVKITNKTVNTDKDIHTTGLKVLNNTQVRKDIPLQQVTAIYNVGDDENLLINGDLDTFSAGIPVNWNLSSNWNAGEISANTGGGIIIDNTFLSRSGGISPETEIADSSLSSSKYIESDPIDISSLNSFKLSAELYADSDIDTIRIRIEMIGSSTNTFQYYVNKYGKVVRSASSIYVDKGDIDTAKMLDISWKNESDDFDMEFVDTMKIRIYPGVRLRSGDPSRMMVKYKNIVLTGSPRFYDTEYIGRKWEYTNTNLPTSKKQEPFTIKFEDFGIFPSREKKHTSKLFLANKTSQTKDWKRTNETVNHSLVESMLIDRLAVSSKYGDIIEGSVFGYVSLFETLTIDSTNQRFVVLWSEYSLQNNQSEVYVTELYATSVNTSIKVYDLFENDKIVDVTSTEEVSTINVNDTFDKPITTNGGIIHGILYPDGGIDSLPKDTTNPRAGNKGVLIFGGTNAEEITLGNKENQTLVDVLGGKIKIGYNLFYDKSIIDGEGDVVKQLGLDSDFQVDGRIEAVSGISVGQDGVLMTITKELGVGGQTYGQIDAHNELRLISPVVNVTQTLGVNQITGINGNFITANAPIYFTQPIYVQASANPNSPITNAQFDTALSSYDFGNIRIYGSVDVASNGSNITLSGLYTLDGVGLQVGVKVLVKDQTDPKENYIYIAGVGAWSRVTDLPNNSIKGVQVQVLGGGTVNKGGIFVNTNTTEVTIGTTNVTFRQSFQNVLGFNSASLIANNQIFSGTNKFTNKLEVRTPLSDTEAVNLSYVTQQFNSFGSSINSAYWSKISNYGIGTTTSNSLQFYVNNVKKAELLTNGMMTGLKAIHINDGAFNMPFLTSFPNYYGATINNNLHVGGISGTSKALYSLDLIRGSATGYRSGVRFGAYNSAGEVNQFYYGIEYSTADKLSIGRYSSTAMDGASTSLDATKTATVDNLGRWAFGKNAAAYRVDVYGDVNISGMFRINGSFGDNQTFLKSNGTTQSFSILTVADISDIDTVYASKAFTALNYVTKANFDVVAAWGNHAGLYVDKSTNQTDIAGAKTFTTSIQSPIVKAGTDSLNITLTNISGTAPRVASNGTLDFFATTRFDWLTTGNIGRMRLTTTGLRVGSSSNPLFGLHIDGTAGFESLISVGNTSQNIPMSSGTAGQFLRRSNVSNGFYNVDVNRWENFGEFGQFQTHAQFGNISTLPWGTSFVNGTTTGLPNAGLQAHVMKMSIGSEYPDQATYLAIPRPFANYFDGQIYVRGIYGTADSGWISVGGGNFKDYDFDEYEATIKYHGYFYNNTPEGREGFIGFNRLDGGVILEYKYTEIDSNVTTTYRNIMNSDGRLAYQIGNGEAKRYALFEEVGTGGVGVTYTPSEPIFFVGNQINVRTASATQTGVLTKENWTTFNNKQNTLLKASSTQDGYLSKEDFATFLANTGGGTGTTYTFTEPIYLDGTAVKVRVASATQNGVLTKEDWAIFNGKQNTLLKASSTQDGYLSKEDFATFLAGTGSGGGVTYTLADPLFFVGNQINVKTASATENGVLTSTKFSQFDAKLGNGSTVTSYLNYQTNSSIYFNYSAINATASAYIAYIANTLMVGAQTELLIYSVDSKVNIQRNNYPTDGSMFTEVKMGNIMNNSILNFHGTNLNFKTNTTPTNGQKFCVQYDSSKNTFFFVPA